MHTYIQKRQMNTAKQSNRKKDEKKNIHTLISIHGSIQRKGRDWKGRDGKARVNRMFEASYEPLRYKMIA